MQVKMKVETLPVNKETLVSYCDIPAWFEVKSELEVELLDDGFKGMAFREPPVAGPYIKYYGEPHEPLHWPGEFNTSNWIIFFVKEKGKPVGGLTIAWKTKGLWMLGGRDDLVCVWDIRVHPDYRHQGIGTGLFRKAMDWSKSNGYKQLCVETQNVNVPACRFYLKQGCKLGGINRYAYVKSPRLAHEVQLIWFMYLI